MFSKVNYFPYLPFKRIAKYFVDQTIKPTISKIAVVLISVKYILSKF